MRYLQLISLFILIFTSSLWSAVTVDVGLEGLTTPTSVDTPILGTTPDPVQPPTPAALPEPATKNVSGQPSVTDLEKTKHLREPAAENSSSKPDQANFPTTTGAGEVSKIEQKGTGKSEYTAHADGEGELLVFLPTYKPARIIVRLVDLDGEEIYFKGKSLLIWERPDDKAFAPVFFKGNSDEKSMKKDSASDYTAVQNAYKFDMKKGQKLQLEITGQPEASSYARVKGPLE